VRGWRGGQVRASVVAGPGSCRMALVTSSLVSRAAVSGSTGMSQAVMAGRTWRRAWAAGAGPAASRIRRPVSSAGRVGAIAFMGVLRVLLCAGRGRGLAVVWLSPGGRVFVRCSLLLAREMLLQIALQDIGQLTDIEA